MVTVRAGCGVERIKFPSDIANSWLQETARLLLPSSSIDDRVHLSRSVQLSFEILQDSTRRLCSLRAAKLLNQSREREMATGNAKVRAEAARHDPDLRFLGKIAVSKIAVQRREPVARIISTSVR